MSYKVLSRNGFCVGWSIMAGLGQSLANWSAVIRLSRTCILALVLLAITALAAPSAALARGARKDANLKKLDRVLQQIVDDKSGTKHRVIIRAKRGYENWLRQQLTTQGQQIAAEHPSIGGMSLELDAEKLAEYSNLLAIDSISGDPDISPTAAPGQTQKSVAATPTTKSSGTTFSPSAVNTLLGTLGLVPNDMAGAGVTVALIDSGLQPTAAFRHRIKAFYDFTNGQMRARKLAFDDYGHGTHVAGLIGGLQDDRDKDIQGVAPGVDFVVIKVLDNTGSGKTSDVIRAVEFAVANAPDHYLGIDVINLSLGHPIFESAATDPLVQAVEAATRAGVIVVTSAGNFGTNPQTGEIGYAGTTSPGNAPSAITVGAFDHKGTVSLDDNRVMGYSSRGPTWHDGFAKPDVVAPGHYLVSESSTSGALYDTYPTLRRTGRSGRAFQALSGTSMSAGVTTGVVALLHQTALAAGYRLTPNLAKAVLQFTAIPLKSDQGQPYDVLTQGTGGVNAAGALSLVSSFKVTVTDTETAWTDYPRCSVDYACSTVITGTPYLWAANIVWGDNVVWGESVYYNLPIWSLNVVWGDNIVWGDNVVWGDALDAGDNVVWGDNIVWGDDIVWGNSIIDGDNIVWGNNVVWGENLVWGDNVVWGEFLDDNVVWGNFDNVVWGNDEDNVVWGNILFVDPVAPGGQK